VVGRDTRVSGPLLEAALAAGLAAEGAEVVSLGVVPTPCVAWLSAADRVAGAMLSASHNPFPDNGIKLFAAGGRKLQDEVQHDLEDELRRVLEGSGDQPVPTGSAVGRIRPGHSLPQRWADALVATLGGRRLDGLRVAVDAANGAASVLAPAVLRRVGAVVEVVADQPDGCNINDSCGSEHPEALRDLVVATGSDVGLAFDGDADRLIAVDGTGAIVDGDHLLAIQALDRHDRGVLRDDVVVVTVMTNLGFHRAMAAHGIEVVTTAVGDRYVLDELDRGGWELGGEQSGHLIFRDLATTGDGLLSGLQLLDVMARSGRSLADLARSAMTTLPQVLVNVALERPVPPTLEHLDAAVAAAERSLGSRGRVLVRRSGTEPLVRVMVEADDEARARAVAEELADEAARHYGARDRATPGATV
jgi:phosphoglucosamine mutase